MLSSHDGVISDQGAPNKKAKLDAEVTDSTAKELSSSSSYLPFEYVSAAKAPNDDGVVAAVTALAVLQLPLEEEYNSNTNNRTMVMIFSGHRDGTIRRWDLSASSSSAVAENDTSTTTAAAADVSSSPGSDSQNNNNNEPQKSQQQSSQRPSAPIWTISAGMNLTHHETYRSERHLGIAGLAVRQTSLYQDTTTTTRQIPPQPLQDDEHHELTSSLTASYVLYSWNHQREDMRQSNGIPQKIMIWQCSTGERCSAIMIDVGRSSIDGTFANPLISCMVFCRLLLQPQPPPPPLTKKTTRSSPVKAATNNKTSDDVPATDDKEQEKVWVDTVLVGIQATCDDDVYKGKDRVVTVLRATEERNQHQQPPPALLPTKSQQQQRHVTVPSPRKTGNLLPFYEATRQRMEPWIVPDRCFVRALVAIPGNSLYIVSVTETTRTTTNPDDHNVNTAESMDRSKLPTPQDEIHDKMIGQTQAIVLWDACHPGSVLHRFDVQRATSPILRGSVDSVTMLSGTNQVLLLSTSTPMATSVKKRLLAVIDLPSPWNSSSSAPSFCSLLELFPGSASTGFGDMVAICFEPGASSKTSMDENVVSLFSADALVDTLPSLSLSNKPSAEAIRHLALAEIAIPPSNETSNNDNDPAIIVICRPFIIVGSSNGTILSTHTPSWCDVAASQSGTRSIFESATNEFVSCSKASIGLRTQLCPHVSAQVRGPALRNECAIT